MTEGRVQALEEGILGYC